MYSGRFSICIYNIMKATFIYILKFLITDSLKLTSLHDYYQRLLHGTQPMPSGLDIANTLKYFSQTLLCKWLCTSNYNICFSIYMYTCVCTLIIVMFLDIFYCFIHNPFNSPRLKFFSSVERSARITI